MNSNSASETHVFFTDWEPKGQCKKVKQSATKQTLVSSTVTYSPNSLQKQCSNKGESKHSWATGQNFHQVSLWRLPDNCQSKDNTFL